MDKTKFLSIYCTFGNTKLARKTLPSIIDETNKNDARLIVHDSTVGAEKKEKWEYLQELADQHGFFLLLTSNLSMAHARNLCMHTGIEMYAPDIIAMMEDDHGYNEGFISSMINAVGEHYGNVSPNNLRYGLFTGCNTCNKGQKVTVDGTNHLVRTADQRPGLVGGCNSCFRCAPTSHWLSVLKGYDTDEYLISKYQTSGLNHRNYQKGFTTMILDNGEMMFDVEAEGRGVTSTSISLWDDNYCASDLRSVYLGKKGIKDRSVVEKKVRTTKTKTKKILKKLKIL